MNPLHLQNLLGSGFVGNLPKAIFAWRNASIMTNIPHGTGWIAMIYPPENSCCYHCYRKAMPFGDDALNPLFIPIPIIPVTSLFVRSSQKLSNNYPDNYYSYPIVIQIVIIIHIQIYSDGSYIGCVQNVQNLGIPKINAFPRWKCAAVLTCQSKTCPECLRPKSRKIISNNQIQHSQAKKTEKQTVDRW